MCGIANGGTGTEIKGSIIFISIFFSREWIFTVFDDSKYGSNFRI